MLEWLKKLRGGKAFENRAGLDQDALALLAEDFDSLETVEADLPAEVMRYVLDGEGEDVLTRLTGNQKAAAALGLLGPLSRNVVPNSAKKDDAPRKKFFATVRNGDPRFFVRLGKIYEAVSGSSITNRQALVAHVPHYANILPPPAFGDPKLGWLESFLIEATQIRVNTWPRVAHVCAALTASLLEAMLEAEGYPPELLVRTAFLPQLPRFGSPPLDAVFKALPDLPDSVVRHKNALLDALNHSDFKQRIYALDLMISTKIPVEPFAEKLIDLALDSSKQVREKAENILGRDKPAALPLVERKVIAGTNEERALAVELLHNWAGEKARPLLESRLAEEKNKKVLRAIEEALALGAVAAFPTANAALELPPLAPVSAHAPLGQDTEHAWQECVKKFNAAVVKYNTAQAGRQHQHLLNSVTPDLVKKAFLVMQNGGSPDSFLDVMFRSGWQKELIEPIKEFWQRPELQLIHLVRFLIQVGVLRPDSEHDRGVFSYGYWLESLMPLFRRVHPEVGLRELGGAFKVAGLNSRRIGSGLLYRFDEVSAPFGLPPAQIWPYWAENLDVLEQALVTGTGNFETRFYNRYARENAFHALATFPYPPERLIPSLWKLALGGKSERPAAQRCLAGLPDKVDRLIASLKGGDAESRFAAAEWMGRIGDKRALEPLLAALKSEKNEVTKGGMMSALELLGAPVEQFLDAKALLKEAEKGAGKGVPEDLKWFPFENLPPVHWSENGKPVEPVILKWWLIQGFKFKNPEPGALLRKYCASIKALEREALGQFVLDAWLAEDTAPISRAEAESRTMQQAQQQANFCQSSYWPQHMPKKTKEEFYADFLPGFLLQPKGSAVASKGVLSLAGACVGAEAAPVVSRYLKQWYGMRAAQCRALLQMLGWVEHKTATQLLLAVGSRFRTKSIQEEANKQSAALAERKGWTVAELADRTIPSAGLDDEGVLTLDFGPRQFTAKLNEDLEFSLFDAEGKPLKSLPEPRKEDDEAKAAEAKKFFGTAKKELKSVITLQRDRFYEAMCTQRSWPSEDWNLYLNRHPIARHHCQRLVWAVVRDEKVVALFRPLADGSLTDANDDPITLKPDDFVRVAHECQITPEQSLAWRQHLKDYEIEPLFEQFGRPGFDLSEARKQDDELADFRGHILEAFKLRGRAGKLGYSRGQAQDGGWFYEYHKRFPTLSMEAVLEFTGNGLPEENRTVGLSAMHFVRVAPEGEAGGGPGKMRLGEMPPVLLSECWNDIRQIAAEGPGFDPEWEKKTQM